MKNNIQNKAVTPGNNSGVENKSAETVRSDVETVRNDSSRIEDEDLKPGEKRVNFPLEQISVVVPIEATDAEAFDKMQEIKSERDAASEESK